MVEISTQRKVTYSGMETANEAPARLFAEAITSGDVEAAVAVCHPQIEFDSVLGISGRLYTGHGGIRRYLEDVASAWDEWRVEVDRITEGPDGRVLIVMTMHARGRAAACRLPSAPLTSGHSATASSCATSASASPSGRCASSGCRPRDGEPPAGATRHADAARAAARPSHTEHEQSDRT